MIGELKQCPKGHYYRGNGTCPFCETKLYPTMTDDLRETKLACIPICPICKKTVRLNNPHPNWPIIGSIEGHAYDGKTPWNYNWDGHCENCGHDFSIIMTQNIGKPDKNRYTTIRVSQRRIDTDFMDAFIGLSGIEIEQRTSTDGIQKLFISTNELKYIIQSLKNSPILDQLDWNEDRT